MFLGKVVGNVWSSVKWPELTGLRLLLVRPYSLSDVDAKAEVLAPPHEAVVCADVLGAGVGEDVVIAYGHAARVALVDVLGDHEQPPHPIDAAIVAIVDNFDLPHDRSV